MSALVKIAVTLKQMGRATLLAELARVTPRGSDWRQKKIEKKKLPKRRIVEDELSFDNHYTNYGKSPFKVDRIEVSADPSLVHSDLNLSNPLVNDAFKKTTILHELREGREIKKNRGERFASHRNIAPALQDLNIASTVTGPGSGVGKEIKKLRKEELDHLKKNYPNSFGHPGLDLGNKRISRHAIKRLRQIFDKNPTRLGE